MRADPASIRVTTPGATSAVELRQLRALLAVVENGSISAAALALGLAQSTVSEALAGLERATGTPVLRRKRGAHLISLTDSGVALLPHARRILQEVDALHVAVAQVSASALGHIRIAANESVSTYLLAPALAVLRRRWSKVRFSVTVGTCPVVQSAVATGASDLGLFLEEAAAATATMGGTPEFQALAIGAQDIALVAFGQRTHPLLHPQRVHPPDALAPYSIFLADSAGAFHDLVSRYFVTDGFPGPRLESVGSIESVKRGVADDARALGLLPAYAIAEELATRKYQAVPVRPALPGMHLVAFASLAGGNAHPAVQELLTLLQHGKG